ncbi:DUF2780 domain-containing protein [Neptunicella sp. SCSIO 80796]|uniref:DUF2780 domain-containing protein n=1 Tax=Neptunicella plasticusilytica TaxID=3117012 RepID=UPI003A4D646E
MMRKNIALLCSLILLAYFSSVAEATTTAQTPLSTQDLLATMTTSLGVTNEQAEGGVASIMNYVKDNLSTSDFSQIGNALPGLSGIMDSVPDISNLASADKLSELMEQMGSYSDSLKAINEVKKQFEAMGLSSDMISRFVDQIQNYLNTPQGAEAKKLLMQGVGKLINLNAG